MSGFDIFGVNDVFNAFPVLEGKKVRLRELSASDAPLLLEYISHPEVHRFIAEEDTPGSLGEAHHEVDYWGGLFRSRQSVYWAIAEKDTDRLIGTCGFNYWNQFHRKAELSYDLAYPYWRKGMMSDALRQVIGFGFTSMGLRRISATVSPDNKASIHLLAKLGFTVEGVMKDYKFIRDQFEDAIMYALLNPRV